MRAASENDGPDHASICNDAGARFSLERSASTWRPSRNPLRAEGKTLKAWLRSPSEDACTAFAAS